MGIALDQSEREDHSSQDIDFSASPGDGAGDEDDLPRGGRLRPPKRKRLSELLSQIAADETREQITLGDLMHLMEGRARAALIFLFASPNVLPAPPGLSALLGLPLLYLTAQMMLGRIPWLPRLITERAIPMTTFRGMIARALPLLIRAERLLRPRLTLLVSPGAERFLGAFALMLAVVVTLPIPLANMLPAFAICLIALGVLERDGLWAAIGIGVGLVALTLSGAVAYAMIKTVIFLILGAFS